MKLLFLPFILISVVSLAQQSIICIIPEPKNMQVIDGYFTLSASTGLIVDQSPDQNSAVLFP